MTHVVRGVAIPIQESAIPVEDHLQNHPHQPQLHPQLLQREIHQIAQFVEMETSVVRGVVKLAVQVGGVPVSPKHVKTQRPIYPRRLFWFGLYALVKALCEKEIEQSPVK